MVLSMTGFATKTITLTRNDSSKANVNMSIKSLNSRFFETTCKLPYQLSNLETTFIKLFKKKLLRGHIHFTVHVHNQNVFQEVIEPSLNTITAYMNAIEQIKKQFSVQGDLSLDTLIQLPNVLRVQEQEIDEQSKKLLLQAAEELIDLVVVARQQEGAALEADLQERIVNLNREIAAIELAAIALVEEQKNKVSELLQEIAHDESKLGEARKSALYAILDKIDIHEEVVRFKSHMHNVGEQLAAQGLEKGKKLDFTLQELAREINTIAAKCSDAAIGSRAINVKVEIEKAREQVQNIV
ncbi:YicC family protein [Candidatus Dependentiae bacterium HGW-Dependentiae-1]|nr:MAG: YicC family protein [Candidatus Dependentiae bacterium HGW-Dependentiae-1]